MSKWYEEAIFYHIYPLGLLERQSAGRIRERRRFTGCVIWTRGLII